MKKNGTTPWLLATLTSEGAVNGKPFHFLRWSTLERFIDPELIKAGVSQLDEKTLSERERIGLQQFRHALKRKEEGKPELTGSEWHDNE
jgi:hypothetical protein